MARSISLVASRSHNWYGTAPPPQVVDDGLHVLGFHDAACDRVGSDRNRAARQLIAARRWRGARFPAIFRPVSSTLP